MSTLNRVDLTSQSAADLVGTGGPSSSPNLVPSNKTDTKATSVALDFSKQRGTALNYKSSIEAVMPEIYTYLSSKEACHIRNIFWALFRSSNEYKRHPEYHNSTAAQVMKRMAEQQVDQGVDPNEVSCPEALQQISHIDKALQETLKEIARLHGFTFEVEGLVYGDTAKLEQAFALEGMSDAEKIKDLYLELHSFAKNHKLQNLPSIETWGIDIYGEILRIVKCRDILTIWEKLRGGSEHIKTNPSLKGQSNPELLEETLLQWLCNKDHPRRRELTLLWIDSDKSPYLYHFPRSILKELSSTLTTLMLSVRFIDFSEIKAPHLTELVVLNAKIHSFQGANFPRVFHLNLFKAKIHSFQGAHFPAVTGLYLEDAIVYSFEGTNFPLLDKIIYNRSATVGSFDEITCPNLSRILQEQGPITSAPTSNPPSKRPVTPVPTSNPSSISHIVSHLAKLFFSCLKALFVEGGL